MSALRNKADNRVQGTDPVFHQPFLSTRCFKDGRQQNEQS